MTDPTVKDRTIDSWTDADHSTALAHLRQLQDQLTDLRTIVPNLIQPLSFPQNSPESLFSNFKHSAFRATHLLKNFRTQWEATETTQILQQVQANKDFEIKGLRTNRIVLNHRDGPQKPRTQDLVLQNKSVFNDNERKSQIQGVEDPGPDLDLDNSSILKKFGERHPDIAIREMNDDTIIDVYVSTKSGQIRFTVMESTEPSKAYHVTCQGGTKLCQAITNALKERIRQSDLQHTLENIAAYRSLFTEKCASCGQLLDSEAMLPVVKVHHTNSSSSGEYKSGWLAYHRLCSK